MYYRFLRFPGGKPKAVTFSYDDAPRYDLQMLEIMDKYGIKCTVNVNNYVVDDEKRGSKLTPDEIRKHVIGKGHEVALHCATHKAPGRLSTIDGIHEVLDNRLVLEKEFGGIIRGMAYPDSGITKIDCSNGVTKSQIKNYLKDLGVAYSRSLAGDNDRFVLPEDWHEWIPSAHHTNPKVFDYIDSFLTLEVEKMYITSQYPRLLYIWGHSYEFNNDNNWDLLEEICKRLSNKEDIWYATNIEIYDYVNAYNSLISSADGYTLYNPTLITVWFSTRNRMYKIEPGETVTVEE
jgi:peptidoglycan/xylan/chitin deacetylase (PgdA/CDA1 family)